MILAAIGLALLVWGAAEWMVPQIQYSLATKREASGDDSGAKFFYRAAGDFRDSEERYNALALSHPAVGDLCRFGQWEQDNDRENGAEAILWRVMEVEDGRALLLSDLILDAVKYHRMPEYVTWEDCDLRAWLNGDFYRAAFSAGERARILETVLPNNANPEYGIPGGAETRDHVFALSIEEAERLFLGANPATANTPYAKRRGAMVGLETGMGWWWLRSPGFQSDFAAVVIAKGEIMQIGAYVNNGGNGVRPAIWFKIEEST